MKPVSPLRQLYHRSVFIRQSIRCLPFCQMKDSDEKLLREIYEKQLESVRAMIQELEAAEPKIVNS